MGAYIYDALCDGLIDGIKDELVVDVLLVTQGRSCPSQLQVVIQLCIVTKSLSVIEAYQANTQK